MIRTRELTSCDGSIFFEKKSKNVRQLGFMKKHGEAKSDGGRQQISEGQRKGFMRFFFVTSYHQCFQGSKQDLRHMTELPSPLRTTAFSRFWRSLGA